MSRRVFFFAGKGGVGKTTCSLAMARRLSARGPVTVASLDPAHNLGDLAAATLGPEPRSLAPGLRGWEPDLDAFARQRSETAVRMIERDWVHLEALNLGSLPALIRHSPGLAEQAALDALEELDRRTDDGETLVVDMPPTGLAVRTLALPALQEAWTDVLEKLRRRILDRRAAVAHVHDRAHLERGRGGAPVFLDPDEDPVLGEIRTERSVSRRLRELIAGPGGHLLVVDADPASVAEAARLRQVICKAGTDARALVVNRIRRSRGGPEAGHGCLSDLPVVRVPEMERPRERESLDEIGALLAGGL